MSDVPLGMFLSGGIDSSAIAALMARHDRPAAADLLGRVQGSRVQRARLRARGRHRDRRGVARDRHRRPRLLRRAAEAGLARGRADRAPVERAAVFRLGARAPARHRRAHRRRQRRAARRLRQVPAHRVELARRHGLRTDDAAARCARRSRAACFRCCRPRSARYARRSFLAMDRTPESMFFDNFASIRLADQRQLLAAGAARRGDARSAPTASSLGYFNAPNGSSTLLDRLLYADIKTYLVELLMKQDQMSMAASIESRVPFLDHKLVEFAATPARRVEAQWLDDQARAARVDEGPAAASRSSTGRRWDSRCRSRAGRAARGTASSATSCSIAARASAASSIPPAVDRLLTDHAAGRTDGGDRIWSLLNLELWYRTFIDQEGIQTLPHAHSVAEIGSAAAA